MDRHDHLRSKLCIICCGLAKSVLTPSLEKVVEAYLIINYSTEIKNLARGICGSCQRKLYYINRGNFDRNLPEIFDYSAMKNVRIPRQGECNCMLCSMAMVRQHFGARSSKSRKCGNPAFFKKDPPKGLDFSLLCGLCLGRVGPGHSHHCTNGSLSQNLSKTFTSSTLSKALHIQSKVDDEIKISTGGRPIVLKRTLLKRKASGDCMKLTHNDANRIMVHNGLSQNKMINILGEI